MKAAPIPRAPAAPAMRGGLSYPHGEAVPGTDTLWEVGEGIFWVRMPLPFGIDHINLWVIDGGDHWVIVDSGFPLPALKAQWRALFEGPLAGKPVGRLIVTHYHPDHIGLAGWIASKWRIPLEMSRDEFLFAKALTLETAERTPDAILAFYRAAGWPEDALAALAEKEQGGFARGVHRLPLGYHRLRHADRLEIGGRCWQVVVGNGHSPEHVCLFQPESRILISGDQVLPRITSNISVYPTEPTASPLEDWLSSIEQLRALPEDTLVLPAHNEPFHGLHSRLDQLADDHHRKLDALLDFCETPRTAFESFSVLFRRAVSDRDLEMATGEAIAHLRWLERAGKVRCARVNGVDRYTRIAGQG